MTESSAVTVQHELSPAEEVALSRAVHGAMRLRIPMIVFGAANVGIGTLTGIVEGMEYGIWSGLLTFLPWSLIGGIWLTVALVPFAFWSRAARVLGPHERSLDETGLHIRSGSVMLDLPWHAMSRTLETTDFILFFDARGKVYYMPKRGLRERDHREVLRLLAARSPESLRRLGK